MPRGDQLTRQWMLLQLIDRASGVTVAGAAETLGCAVRTIWRDLRVLQEAGFPIYDQKDGDGRRGLWKVTERFRTSLPVKLTLAELAALLMSRDLLAPLGASALGAPIDSAFDRLTRVLSRDALALIDRMRDVVGARALGAKLQAPAAEHMPRIHRALAERRTLWVRYYSFHRDEVTEREIDPYHLAWVDGGLYLVAWCHVRRAVRIFAVERIRDSAVRSRGFTAPRDFDARKYLDEGWGILRGELVTVKVRFARAVARYIRERLWHPSQRFRDLPDGRLEMTIQVGDTVEVRRWLLGHGVQAEIVEPRSLREALWREAAAMADALRPDRRPLASSGRRSATSASRTVAHSP